ncbi:MAG: hypothetical protein EG825_04715 [Rhodocyclaceae bacterium]|nr:hypothetical protein [Rhodocyclaceae bacterium]
MLADSFSSNNSFGAVGRSVHLEATSLHELLNFIADELPKWRDRVDRSKKNAEVGLTSDLCAHLNGAARRSKGWDILQFRTEVPDEERSGRAIDMAPSPCNATIIVDGRKFTEFDMLMPIECKRLPTPKNKGREASEYVITEKATRGGIQRFKLGLHGSKHKLGGMIAYVQEGTAAAWYGAVTGWINAQISARSPGWSHADHLTPVAHDQGNGLTIYQSTHPRSQPLSDIELQHLWLQMR